MRIKMNRYNLLIKCDDSKEYSEDITTILSPYGMSREPEQDFYSDYIVYSAYDPIKDERHGLGEHGIREITDKLKRFDIKYKVVETYRYSPFGIGV
jgi:hypothetical protein